MNYLKSTALVCVAVCAASLLFSCGRTQTGGYAAGTTVIACDASFRNVMEQEIQVFEYKYKGSNVLDLYVDEDAAIDSLLNLDNNVRSACVTRPLTKQEISYLNSHKRSVNQEAIAIDAVALIVNPANPMEYIDYQDLIDVLTGKYTTWDKISPAASKMGKIMVVFDHQGSSTTRYMRDSLLNGSPFGPNVYAQKTPKEVFEAVARTKNAIGIIGASWLTSDMSGRELSETEIARLSDVNDTTAMGEFNTDVRVLAVQPKDKVDAYLPNQYNIYTGNYPFYRQVYLISTSAPNTVGHSFFTFVTSAVGQKIILSTGICPKIISPQFVEL